MASRDVMEAAARAAVNKMCNGYARRYYTREEKRRWLEGYAQELESELKAVRERIQDLASTA